MRLVDLTLFLAAVYGLSWLVSCSRLARPVRARLAPVPVLGQLVHCIVCVSAWAAVGLALLLPYTTLLPESFRCRTAADVVLLVAAALASTWLVARAVGDAD